MDIGLNSLYNIGSSYTMKLNDDKVLVVEDDELKSTKLSETEKVNKKILQELEKKELQKVKNSDELSEDEERLVRDLQSRDTEVKAHESAHQTAGGGMVGAASYTYQQAPDGKMYAIGGEVSISTGEASSPQEAIANAQQIIASAMAAGSPSPQDFAVATSAKMMQIKAEQQLTRQKEEQIAGIETYKNTMFDKKNGQKKEENSLGGVDIPA